LTDPWVIIMAGGSGTRFWPASRSAKPKQFLSVVGGTPLLRAAYERIAPLTGPERCLVVCGENHAEQVRQLLPELPESAVLAEPVGRNTAPCVAWGIRTLLDLAEADSPVAILPADHHIPDGAGLRAALEQAFAASRDRIVLFGMVPSRPETAYGYIETNAVAQPGQPQPVLRFIEKPDGARAAELVASGRFLWNSGMFIGRAATLWREIRTRLPELARGVERIRQAPDTLPAVYAELPSVSFDHGVLEASSALSVLPLGIAWSDVGSWPAVHELMRNGPDDNVVIDGAVEALESTGCLFDVQTDRLLAAVGVRDLVVVDTPDALLVARRDRAQEVKRLVAGLRAKGREDLL